VIVVTVMSREKAGRNPRLFLVGDRVSTTNEKIY